MGSVKQLAVLCKPSRVSYEARCCPDFKLVAPTSKIYAPVFESPPGPQGYIMLIWFAFLFVIALMFRVYSYLYAQRSVHWKIIYYVGHMCLETEPGMTTCNLNIPSRGTCVRSGVSTLIETKLMELER